MGELSCVLRVLRVKIQQAVPLSVAPFPQAFLQASSCLLSEADSGAGDGAGLGKFTNNRFPRGALRVGDALFERELNNLAKRFSALD